MGTPEFSSYSRTGMFEGVYTCANHRVTMAEDDRETFDTSKQPPACGDRNSASETSCPDLPGRVAQLEEEFNNHRVWSESVNTRLQLLESSERIFAGYLQLQKEHQEKEEENMKLKEKIKELEAGKDEFLSKAMSMHKHSENMNDPLCLSAVLQMYEMLRLHDWEKFRVFTPSMTYKNGHVLIKKLFQACEEDMEQRKMGIFKILDIPPLNDAMTNSNQGIMPEIRNIFRYIYDKNGTKFYGKIVQQTGFDPKTTIQREFTTQCCKIYCLLLLQDPPVKAVWNPWETEHLEHVDKKERVCWRKTAFLWPIMKCGEQVVVKGVVWDEK